VRFSRSIRRQPSPLPTFCVSIPVVERHVFAHSSLLGCCRRHRKDTKTFFMNQRNTNTQTKWQRSIVYRDDASFHQLCPLWEFPLLTNKSKRFRNPQNTPLNLLIQPFNFAREFRLLRRGLGRATEVVFLNEKKKKVTRMVRDECMFPLFPHPLSIF